jgi:LysM repeat protein
MNNLLKYILLLVWMFPLALQAQAPNGNEIVVVVSKEKILVNGKTYYLHTVKKGENLYRIGLAYNVTPKDITAINTDVTETLKEGQVLKIPTESTALKAAMPTDSGKFFYHITEEQQTLYFISQKYKISKEELFKYNPELEVSPLQTGQVVRIPKSYLAPEPPRKRVVERYTDHLVVAKETKYSLSKENNISIDELVAANPSLATDELKVDQTIRIPVFGDKISAIPAINKPDTTKKEEPKKTTVTVVEPVKPFSEDLQVALLLPLFVEEIEMGAAIDSANASSGGSQHGLDDNQLYQISANNVDFYQGVLLALDSLKKAGLSVKVHTYDIGKSSDKIPGILAKPEMAKMDLIIGPLNRNNPATIEKVSQFALKHQIKMVLPVYSFSEILKENPTVFQVNPSDAVGVDIMVKYIATMQNKNIVLLNSTVEIPMYSLFKSKLNQYCPKKFRVFNFSANTIAQIPNYLSRDTDNIIVIPSEEDVDVKYALSQFVVYATKGYNISTYGSSFKTSVKILDKEFLFNLYNLEYHYYTPFFSDYSNPSIQNFLYAYKSIFNTLPYYHTKENNPKEGYNFAFLGFDITWYFLNNLGRYGKDVDLGLHPANFKALHTTFDFERTRPGSGFINKGVNILKYSREYNIEKVR